MIDWKGILEKLSGQSGWEDAEGPDSRVGDDYYFGADDADGKEIFARLNIDQGYGELILQGDDEDDEQTLWSGEIETIADDPELSSFVSNGPTL